MIISIKLLEIIVHYLHLLAAISWVGGMVFVFAILIPTLKQSTKPAKRLEIMKQVGRRFAVISWISIVLLLATGVYKAWDRVQEEQASLAFWRVLSIKIVLVLTAIVLSVLHDFVWGPRLNLARASDDPNMVRRRVLVVARLHFVLLLLIAFLGVLLLHL